MLPFKVDCFTHDVTHHSPAVPSKYIYDLSVCLGTSRSLSRYVTYHTVDLRKSQQRTQSCESWAYVRASRASISPIHLRNSHREPASFVLEDDEYYDWGTEEGSSHACNAGLHPQGLPLPEEPRKDFFPCVQTSAPHVLPRHQC